MAEDSDAEKTEDASAQRLEKAREDGDVPRSRELATFTVLMAAASGFWMSGESIIRQLKHMLAKGLTFERLQVMDPALLGAGLLQQFMDLVITLAPFVALLLLAALGSPMLIGGWLFSTKALGPNFGKLNPISGLANMVSTHALIELLKAIGKTLLVGSVAWFIMNSELDDIFSLSAQSAQVASAKLGHLLLITFTSLVSVLALIALIDAPYQMIHYSQKMKMTRQEVRQEAKESDGNPEIKAKVRAMQREMARRRMMSNVPMADVVVTNPTHYAVAIKYPENSNQAPLVIAKGIDEVAMKIREIAAEHKIVIMEVPPLARALYQHTELGDEIPGPLYSAVAQVLAYVFQLRSWHLDGDIKPVYPDYVEVPADMDPLNSETNT
ncbi:MAG: flagellar biosynthesis protein FlhB [Methylococcaceae bacterium]|jgi:flagellar biosynthetic protein FlhB